MKRALKTKYRFISRLSVVIGSVSLLLFLHFVLFGTFNIVHFELSGWGALFLNLLLSFVFFLQHSVMIRTEVRSRIEPYLPAESFYAVHSICSGLLLSAAVLLWQETNWLLLVVPLPWKYLLYSFTLISIVGLLWATLSLTDFDPFGRKQISNFLENRKRKEQIFILRGAYKITRHPFYFFILLMIWSHPTITVDRLAFALVWTVWVIIGTILEEKDLVRDIGEEYATYQTEVPMLIPYKMWENVNR